MNDNVICFPVCVNISKLQVLECLLSHLAVDSVFKFAVLSVIVDYFNAVPYEVESDELSQFIGSDHAVDSLLLLAYAEEAVGNVFGIDLSVGVDDHSVVFAGFEEVESYVDVRSVSQSANVLDGARFHKTIHGDDVLGVLE